MTIDEAIKHCEEVADTCEFEASKYDMTDAYESHVACQEGECAEEHRQLVEWLKDYKKLLGTIEDIKTEITEPNEMDSLENSNLWQGWFLKLIDKHTSGKEEGCEE